MTGQLEEEKMQVYVRLGIRLLYKVSCRLAPSGTSSYGYSILVIQGALSRLEGARGA
jgi:hypothetical protein